MGWKLISAGDDSLALSAYRLQCNDGREGLASHFSCQGCIGKRRRRMGKATVMTDKDRQDIRYRAVALCQRTAALCTHMRAQCTLLKDQHAQLAARRYRLRALVRQQGSLRAAGCPRRGGQRQTEIGVLTDILARLRRPYGL